MQYPRAVDLETGVAMVVTDLHGVGPAFNRAIGTFVHLHKSGKAQSLIICGDLLHSYGPAEDDHSLRMLSEVKRLQEQMGRETIILLMGNHEMPHVYGVSLTKGNLEFTPSFEQALSASGQRDELLAFLRSLPFGVRTKAGVLLTHMGASPAINSAAAAERFLTFDHEALLRLADDKLHDYDTAALKTNAAYLEQARYLLAIDGPDDPRLVDLLRGQLISQGDEEFEFLWKVLFAQNENRWGHETYKQFILPAFLQAFSAISPHQQRVIVSGHIGVRGGHKIVSPQQLRLASYAHANPQDAGEYLLLNCEQPVESAMQLEPHLHRLMA